ncbi:MAG: hypothetical protein ACOYEJ_07040 [Mahellales bacterium]
MNNILKVIKYQLRDFRISLIVFYGIVLAIIVIGGVSYSNLSNDTNVSVSFSGFGMAAVIFIFVAGLNCFRDSFKFIQANNVSRKSFFMGNGITIISVAALMAIVEAILDSTLKHFFPYQGLFQQLYKSNSMVADFLWSFGLYAFAVSLGWFITMVYYRSSKLIKTIVSLIPAFIIILLVVINNLTAGALGRGMVNLLAAALGFGNDFNAYMAVLSFWAATAVLLGLSFLLIRRMPVKD